MDDMKNHGMRYSASNPKLNDRIYTKIDPTKNTVFWYIKFNIPLDPSSVTEKSMYVSDIGGYKMQTFIEYSTEYNLISISPIDTYSQDIYYILHISTSVKSAKGNKLPRKINILFKLINDEISEYEVLKKEIEVPEVVPRPKNYDAGKVHSKVYGLDKDTMSHLQNEDLPLLPFRANPIIGILVYYY